MGNRRLDQDRWNKSLLVNYSIVAIDGGQIVGFGDIDKTNYLDRLYVHKDFQGFRLLESEYPLVSSDTN